MCKELLELLPKNHETVYLTNSGTEAIEGALELAKKATGRIELIGAHNSYHGSTHGVMSLLNRNQKKGYGPLLPEIKFIKFNDNSELEKITKKTAAVLLETIQGGAGFIVPDINYLQNVKSKCDSMGALLILDEIQPGFGRTGRFFGFEHFNVQPDIVVMGKGMGGGLPIGAFSSSYKLMKCFQDKPKLGHITTFGGNPVVASAALATLRVLRDSKLMSQIKTKETLLENELKHPEIIELTGMGLMLAAIVKNSEMVDKIIEACLEKGVLLFRLLWKKMRLGYHHH